MNWSWFKAVSVPSVVAAFHPFVVVVERLLNPGAASEGIPSIFYFLWFPLCLSFLVAWSGWRVVEGRAGNMRAAAVGGGVTFLSSAVPAFAGGVLAAPTHEPTMTAWSPYVLAILAVIASVAMCVGWLGGFLATRRGGGVAT